MISVFNVSRFKIIKLKVSNRSNYGCKTGTVGSPHTWKVETLHPELQWGLVPHYSHAAVVYSTQRVKNGFEHKSFSIATFKHIFKAPLKKCIDIWW